MPGLKLIHVSKWGPRVVGYRYRVFGNFAQDSSLMHAITHDDVIKWKLALWAGVSPVTGEFLSQKSVTRSFDVFFDLRLNERLSKPSRCRWYETPSRS